MYLPNWFDVFNSVCERGQDTLKWGLPEPWVHAELYAELTKQAPSTGWAPFSIEVPYVTFFPVQLPKKANRDWKAVGAVKWVDLCLQSKGRNAWCWFEFKVRHVGSHERKQKAALSARDAFRKDVVALMGFDANLTAETWARPDSYTTAYWFESVLKPDAPSLRSGEHHFVAAFLQLGDELDPLVWAEKVLMEQIRKWFSYRSKQIDHQGACPDIDIASSVQSLVGNHSLLVCEWASLLDKEGAGC
jgi:hypothetical protein